MIGANVSPFDGQTPANREVWRSNPKVGMIGPTGVVDVDKRRKELVIPGFISRKPEDSTHERFKEDILEPLTPERNDDNFFQ